VAVQPPAAQAPQPVAQPPPAAQAPQPVAQPPPAQPAAAPVPTAASAASATSATPRPLAVAASHESPDKQRTKQISLGFKQLRAACSNVTQRGRRYIPLIGLMQEQPLSPEAVEAVEAVSSGNATVTEIEIPEPIMRGTETAHTIVFELNRALMMLRAQIAVNIHSSLVPAANFGLDLFAIALQHISRATAETLPPLHRRSPTLTFEYKAESSERPLGALLNELESLTGRVIRALERAGVQGALLDDSVRRKLERTAAEFAIALEIARPQK
jgi:hypothetical protein